MTTSLSSEPIEFQSGCVTSGQNHKLPFIRLDFHLTYEAHMRTDSRPALCWDTAVSHSPVVPSLISTLSPSEERGDWPHLALCCQYWGQARLGGTLL